MRPAVSCFLVLVLLLWPRAERAHAAATTVYEATSVEPGTSCVVRNEVALQVARWLGSATVPAGISIGIRGSSDDPSTVSFKLARDGTIFAQRTFAAAPARCEELHSILGLAVALALRAALVDWAAAEGRADTNEDAAAKGHATGDAPRWRIGAALLAGLGLAPRLTAGGELNLQRRAGRHFAIDAGVLALAARDIHFQHAPGAFSLRWFGARLGGCALFELGVRLSGCLGVRASAILVHGEGYPHNRQEVLSQYAATSELGVAIPLSKRWSLNVAATCVVPLQRTRFQVRTNGGTVIDTRTLASAAAQASVGPGYHF